jgi:hypothetical protein
MITETRTRPSNVYTSEHATRTRETRWERLGNIAKKAGRVALNTLFPPVGLAGKLHRMEEASRRRNQSTGNHRPEDLLGQLDREAARKAEILHTYDGIVKQPALLPGERPRDPKMRRVRTGVYNSPNGRTARVAVYDQPQRGWTGVHQRGVGVTIAEEMMFEDGRRGVRKVEYTPGFGLELRVATTDYTQERDGGVRVRRHNTGWASEAMGGAPATMDQVVLVQEVITGNTVWAPPVVAPDLKQRH